MPTKREYLVSKKLAQPGRGRFSREAVAELERARQSGVTFSDDEKGSGSVQADPDSSIPLPGGWTAKPIKSLPVIRQASEVKGYSTEGYLIATGTCYRCYNHVSRCPCKAGVTPSSSIVRWHEDSEAIGIDLSARL
jgi:hypothetical protein